MLLKNPYKIVETLDANTLTVIQRATYATDFKCVILKTSKPPEEALKDFYKGSE